ncbi:MAG: hypothetical protein JST00_13755 [Deltaproteobacteria bacterium]|nr:hypothetical protein [Deltaproteobacteria bacterium]
MKPSRTSVRPSVLAMLLALGACASENAANPSLQTVSAQELAFSIAPSIAAGTEMRRCQLVAVPEAHPFLVAIRHQRSTGVHHIAVHVTDLDAAEPEPFDCDGPRNASGRVRGTLYTSDLPDDSLALREGVGLPLRAGTVLMIEAHLLNPHASSLNASLRVALTTDLGDRVREHAGVFALAAAPNPGKPFRLHEASALCSVSAPSTILAAAARRGHERASLRAFIDLPDAPATAAPFYASSLGAHVASLARAVAIPTGARVRLRCEYDDRQNAEADATTCALSGLYYPAAAKLEAAACAEPASCASGGANVDAACP